MKAERRAELLELLVAVGDFRSPGVGLAEAHRKAEELLLELLSDEEVTRAWEQAADQWWYA